MADENKTLSLNDIMEDKPEEKTITKNTIITPDYN